MVVPVKHQAVFHFTAFQKMVMQCKKVISTEGPEIYLDLHASIVHPNQMPQQTQTRFLHFMADIPHLFKNICQALINNRTFTISDEIVLK